MKNKKEVTDTNQYFSITNKNKDILLFQVQYVFQVTKHSVMKKHTVKALLV